MDIDFLNILPEKSKELVSEIETYSGFEIQVLPNPTPVSATDPNPNAPACMVTETSAQILHRGNNIDPQGFTHELLHIYRYLVQQIPQVIPVSSSDSSNFKVTSQIENALEHLVIVPLEQKYGFDPHDYWNKTVKQNWEKIDHSSVNTFAIRKNCLLGWLTVSNLVTDEETKQIAERKINKLGYLDKAKQLNFKVVKYKKSKEKQLSCVINFLRIPNKEVQLLYLNSQDGQRIEKPVPEYKG